MGSRETCFDAPKDAFAAFAVLDFEGPDASKRSFNDLVDRSRFSGESASHCRTLARS
jgi:hypothetical protein